MTNTKREALIVGINKYPRLGNPSPRGNNPRNLNNAARDAEAIAQGLQSYNNLIWHITLMPKKQQNQKDRVDSVGIVKKHELETAITKLLNPESNINTDVALLFFSGHGLRKKDTSGKFEGFLATSDAYGIPGKNNWGVSLNWLCEQLIKSPVKNKIVWLECCYSGLLFTHPNNQNELKKLRNGVNSSCCLIVASGDDKTALALRNGHGKFTSVLLEALDFKHQQSLITTDTVVNYVEQKRTSILLPQKTPSALNFGNGIPLWSGNASSIKIEIDKLLKELSDLLEDKNFSQANKKTWEILFKAAKKEQIDRLEETDLEKIDCNILIEIVELWSDSNSGFFGFRVQKLIWEEICKGIQPFNKDKAIVEFAQKVEWYKEDKRRPWQLRHEISNHVISIKGYLPVPLYSNNNRIDKKDISLIAAIAQRLGECESEDKQES